MLSPPPASKREPLMSLTSPSQALVLASVSWEPGMSSIDCSLVLQNSHPHPPGTVGSDPSPRGPLNHTGLSPVAPLSLLHSHASSSPCDDGAWAKNRLGSSVSAGFSVPTTQGVLRSGPVASFLHP